MSRNVYRLLPFAVANGPRNMADDEVLLGAAAAGVASLRFYAWSPATISLGYFQPHGAIRDNPRLAALPYVRRPSGGLTLVHHHEVTYALAVPAGSVWQAGERGLCAMHRIIAEALATWGIRPSLHEAPDRHADTLLCFRHVTAGDLCIDGCKVVGSAQRGCAAPFCSTAGSCWLRATPRPNCPAFGS